MLKYQNVVQLASVQVGGAICLPLLLVGYELAKEIHPLTLLMAILWGNLFLFLLAVVAGHLSCARRIPTAGHAAYYLGNYGKQAFGIVLGLSMLGWFAIQAQSMGHDLYYHLSKAIPYFDQNSSFWLTLVSLVIAVGIILGVFCGLTFITSLSNLCVPFLVVTIIYAIYTNGFISTELFTDNTFAYWDSKATSLIVASSISATVDLPTFYRHAETPRIAAWASCLTFLVATPLVQLAGVWLYHSTSAGHISEALAAGNSTGWQIWVLFFMMLAGWTTNNINLYSASMSMQVLGNMSYKKALLYASAVALVFVMFPLLSHLTFVLEVMGIMVSTMGGVILIAYFCDKKLFSLTPQACWIAALGGILVGLTSLFVPMPYVTAPLFVGVAVAITILILFQIKSFIGRTIT